MRPTYNGFEAKKNSGFAQLPPPGCYVAEIQGVRTDMSYDKTHEVIILMIEITDGEYAGQYHKVFEEQKNSFGDNVKYRGTFRLTPPIEGDEEWVKAKFEGMLWCIQESNPGYAWDWNEQRLVGKKIGINIRKSFYKGNDGTEKETTEIGQLETIDDVRNGKTKPMKERRQKGSGNSTDTSDGRFTQVHVDVPF